MDIQAKKTIVINKENREAAICQTGTSVSFTICSDFYHTSITIDPYTKYIEQIKKYEECMNNEKY